MVKSEEVCEESSVETVKYGWIVDCEAVSNGFKN